jgi:hypothetical protein
MNPSDFLEDEEATVAATLVIVLLPVDETVNAPSPDCPRYAIRFAE